MQRLPLVLSGLAAWLAACGSAPGPMVIDLVVDANRNGQLDPGDPEEEMYKNTWDARHGAIVLANLDDDDQKGDTDASDNIVNGDRDVLDLSPIQVRAWPDAPPGTRATLIVDALSEPNVNLFSVVGPPAAAESYTQVMNPIALSDVQMQKGALFAVEATDLPSSISKKQWGGVVQFTLTVQDQKGAVLATDHAQMRVAPLLFQFNTAPTEAVYYSDFVQLSQPLLGGVKPASSDAGVSVDALELSRLELDQWAQDFFDIGYASKPGPGGKAHGMKIAVRSPQPTRKAGAITTQHFLGPDFGAVFKHAPAGQQDFDESLGSFGNWDVIPPYTKGKDSYPLGRNIWGSGQSRAPDPVFAEFVRAQRVQPDFQIDTSWLVVGHVDEILSWVATRTPRGWGQLVAWPRLAREMLLGLQKDGHGGAVMFTGKNWLQGMTDMEVPAQVTVDAVLANADLMAASQEAQVHIEEQLAALQKEVGLADDEVTYMPFLLQKSFDGLLAYQPGTVNLLHLNGHVVVPDPDGPMINGVDPFKEDVKTRLGALGLKVFFSDVWDLFHRLDGEVHCGTNVSRAMNLKWWESGR